jgi:hypothetical protein
MFRGSRHLGKILGYFFSPIKSSTSRCSDVSRRVGRGDIWRRQWELLENRVYNKPNGYSATGALASGPDHQQQQQGGTIVHKVYNSVVGLLKIAGDGMIRRPFKYSAI